MPRRVRGYPATPSAKTDVDKWPSDPHGHILDERLKVGTDGKIYDVTTRQQVGKLSKKGLMKWTRFLSKCGKVITIPIFIYNLTNEGAGAATEDLIYDVTLPVSSGMDYLIKHKAPYVPSPLPPVYPNDPDILYPGQTPHSGRCQITP